MAYEYSFQSYDFHYGDEQQAKVDAMAKAGWRVHTASATYPEVAILWEREAATASESAEPSNRSEPEAPPAPPEASEPAVTRHPGTGRFQSSDG
jgi:hypothetical protein